MRGISGLANEVLASQEGLYFTELVIISMPNLKLPASVIQ
jgi:hypothetical protein